MNNTATPFVKVCGLTSLGHIRAAELLGARYVGLVVEVSRSPRTLSREQARLLARAVRAQAVLVTTAAEPDRIAQMARFVQADVVQLHGDGGAPLVEQVRAALPTTEVWRVIALDVEADGSADDAVELRAQIERAVAAGAHKLLIDSAKGGQTGGTGLAADWRTAAKLAESAGQTPVILAGGLSAANVAEAIRLVRPQGVDVSSGVESAPGVKSPHLMREFFAAVTLVT